MSIRERELDAIIDDCGFVVGRFAPVDKEFGRASLRIEMRP